MLDLVVHPTLVGCIGASHLVIVVANIQLVPSELEEDNLACPAHTFAPAG